MSRQKFGSESARLTQWLPAGQIDVDPAIQRPLNAAWAEKIGRELDPDLIGVIHVSHRANGRYVVIDGQHRLHGIKNVFGNNGTLVECKVYTGLTKAQEAAQFVGLNDFRRPQRIDVFLKSVVAKEPDAVAINNIASDLGYRIERQKGDKQITAVGALEDVFWAFADRRVGESGDKPAAKPMPELLKATLVVVGNAWGGTSDSLHGHIISGIGRLLLARQRAMDIGDFVHKLSTYPGGPTALLGAAAGHRSHAGGKVSHAVAEVCLNLYNKGRRVAKLEPLR